MTKLSSALLYRRTPVSKEVLPHVSTRQAQPSTLVRAEKSSVWKIAGVGAVSS